MSEASATCGVAIVGCGTVGGATAVLLTRDAEVLAARTDPRPELRYVVDVDWANARISQLTRERTLEAPGEPIPGEEPPAAGGEAAVAGPPAPNVP